MNRFRNATIGLVAMGLLAAAGCTGDPDATASSTSSTVDSARTEPASSAVPTSPASEPPPTSANASTVLVTTTTVDQIAAAKAAVSAAAVQSRLDYLYAVQNYDAPDAMAVLSSHVAANSPALQLGIQNMETLRSRGWRVRPNPDVPSSLTVESDVTLLDGPPPTKAEVTVCTSPTVTTHSRGIRWAAGRCSCHPRWAGTRFAIPI